MLVKTCKICAQMSLRKQTMKKTRILKVARFGCVCLCVKSFQLYGNQSSLGQVAELGIGIKEGCPREGFPQQVPV